MKGRTKAKPPITWPIWKQEGKLWFAEATDLEMAIRDSGHSEDELRRKMLAGYAELQEALKGKRIEGWTVTFIEHALRPVDPNEKPMPLHSGPPNISKS